MTMSWYK